MAEKVRNLEPGHGLNAATGEYVDLIAAGIIDPAKVTRSALQNAASIAGLFLTTEAVVADKPEKAAPWVATVAWVVWTSDRQVPNAPGACRPAGALVAFSPGPFTWGWTWRRGSARGGPPAFPQAAQVAQREAAFGSRA